MKRVLALAVVMLFLSASELYAGAWTVPKHKVWGELYEKWSYAKEEFNQDGKRQTLSQGKEARYWEYMMEPKLEFGVTDYLTAMASLEYKEAHYKEYGRPDSWGPYSVKNHGITNIKVGGRFRFLEDPVVMSTQTRVWIYPGYPVNHHEEGDWTAHQPMIGYGDDAVEQRILIGKTFILPIHKGYKIDGYWGIETGYRWRTKSVCYDIPYFAEIGVRPIKGFLLKTEIDGYKAVKGTGSIYSEYGFWRIGGVWEVFGGDSTLRQGEKMFNLEFQYGTMVWGKNTSAPQEFVLKVSTQF